MAEDIAGTTSFTNGAYEIPTDKDTGDDWADIIETFMTRLSAHSHTGADSNVISLNIEKGSQELTLQDGVVWQSVGNGIYRAVIPVAIATSGTYTYENTAKSYFFRVNETEYEVLNGAGSFATDGVDSEWAEFNPETQDINGSTYNLFSNDNLLDIKVITV